MVRKLAYLVTAAGVVAFTVGFIAVLSGRTGILAALLIIGFFGFMVGVFAIQFAGQGMTRGEGPSTFADVDATPASARTPRASDEPRAHRTWTRTWLGIYFWVALGEFYLGLLFVIGAVVVGGAAVPGLVGTAVILWLVAAPFAYCAFRTAAKDRLHQTGLPGRATILGVTQTGAWMNNNPVTVLDLSIKVDGHPAYEVRHRETVPQTAIGRLTSGESLPVRVSRDKPSDFVVEWESS